MVRSDSFKPIADQLANVVWLVISTFEEGLYVDPAYERLAGPPDEVSDGIEILDCLHDSNSGASENWPEPIRAAIDAGATTDEYRMEIAVEHLDGDKRWAETLAVPIYD